jgi:sortase A
VTVSRTGNIVRPVLRFIAHVLIVAGVLMLLDAALTVTWQEPVSAFIAARKQGSLETELKAAPAVLAPLKLQLAKEPDPAKKVKRLAAAWDDHVHTGDAIGKIDLPTLDRKYVVSEGTDTDTLRNGPGHYPKTSFPGEGGTVAIAGHRTTYGAPFRTIDKLKKGQPIILDMPYAKLTYEVEKTQVVDDQALWVTNRVPGPERLVLSACHPLYSAAQRIIAFGRLKSIDLK